MILAHFFLAHGIGGGSSHWEATYAIGVSLLFAAIFFCLVCFMLWLLERK